MNRAFVGLVLLLGACSSPLVPDEERTIEALPSAAVFPEDAPPDEARVELGRALFWDPVLSGERDVACATCHHPSFGYADGRALSLGSGAVGLGPHRAPSAPHAVEVTRNAPTVLDVAFNGWVRADEPVAPELAPMFWDSRATSLEAQALGPLLSEAEMRGPNVPADRILSELVARLEAIPAYRALFVDAFGDDVVDVDRITTAIATFERTLIARESTFDRFMNGDDEALDLSQRRGLVAFFDAGCAACHSGPMFSDYELHDLGVGDTDRVRTPSLRNTTRTAPYMHDGSRETLHDVIDFYRGVDRGRDPALRGLQPVSARQTTDILHFLEALSDGSFDDRIPEAVPSGLPVGGAASMDSAAGEE